MISRGRLTALAVLGCAGLFAGALVGLVRPEEPPSVDRIELRPQRRIDLAKSSPIGAADRRSQPAVGAIRRGEGQGRGSVLDPRTGGDDDAGFGDDDGGAGEREEERNRSGGGSRLPTTETNVAGGGDDGAGGGDDASLGGDDDSGDDGGDD